jgi:hypothetical protein
LINLVPVQASADAVSLPEPVDVALVVDTYHHIGNRTQYFAKLKSSLRPAIRKGQSGLNSGSTNAKNSSARRPFKRFKHGAGLPRMASLVDQTWAVSLHAASATLAAAR